MTTVRVPIYVPNACAKRVSKMGVSESPITPRTPEMLILRVGIGRMICSGLGGKSEIWSAAPCRRFALQETSRRFTRMNADQKEHNDLTEAEERGDSRFCF